MHTLLDFVQFALSFVPMIVVVAILIALFWAAAKLFPSLGAWMTNTDDMVETESDRYHESRRSETPTFDRYV